MILAVTKLRGRTAVVVGLDDANIALLRRGQPAWVEGDLVDKQATIARGVPLRDADIIIGYGSADEIRAQIGQNVKEPPVADRLADLKAMLQDVLKQHGDVDGHHLENAIRELGLVVDELEGDQS